MTVSELIEELKKFDGNMEVLTEDGMDPSDPCPVKFLEVRTEKDKAAYGNLGCDTSTAPYVYIYAD